MKILIVEDEPMILKGISFLITEYDYPNIRKPEIIEANDGIEAEKLLKNNDFDFVFTDIKMPELSGLELINNWYTLNPNTQWVIISGYNDFDFAKRAIQFGVKDYLLKPITRKNINETLSRLIKSYNETFDSCISIAESNKIVNQLVDAIWILDIETIQNIVKEWTRKAIQQSLGILPYKKYMSELLQLLITRLNLKGVKEATRLSVKLEGESKLEIYNHFLNKCQELIDVLKIRRKGNTIDPIEAAKKYISDHLEERLNLEDVAEIIGFNPSYFSQLFKKETGETFVSYRKKVRLERAKQLLEEGRMRIIDISNEIGYGDLPHFAKSFKEYTGKTPSEYRSILGIKS